MSVMMVVVMAVALPAVVTLVNFCFVARDERDRSGTCVTNDDECLLLLL